MLIIASFVTLIISNRLIEAKTSEARIIETGTSESKTSEAGLSEGVV